MYCSNWSIRFFCSVVPVAGISSGDQRDFQKACELPVKNMTRMHKYESTKNHRIDIIIVIFETF